MEHLTSVPAPVGAIRHGACGKWWTGSGRSHCPNCHETFSSETAANRHRKGVFGVDRHCVAPSTVGLVAVEKPWGLLWQNPGPDVVVSGTPSNWVRGGEAA